ncbi:MAG: hypothetical protein QF503_07910 [Rhodospirillales bacterium]|nr:hypothetical protein [Rhodospirillales bacterium]
MVEAPAIFADIAHQITHCMSWPTAAQDWMVVVGQVGLGRPKSTSWPC